MSFSNPTGSTTGSVSGFGALGSGLGSGPGTGLNFSSGATTGGLGQTPQAQLTFGSLGSGDAGITKSDLQKTQTTSSAPSAATTTTNPPSLAVTSSSIPATTANLSTATKTTDSSTFLTSTTLNFSQIEEHINKWTLELEEQQKNFTNQATTVNAWDKLLISNSEKIMNLNDAVKKVQADQKMLEQELEFISTQHSELEESLSPLQKELHNISQVDVERSQTYVLVENLDTQLRQMTEDLKQIIDKLNETNKNQDNNDPIVQIGKILNAHMSSLQWIESSSSAIGAKLNEISRVHEMLKKDAERSSFLSFYDQ